MPKREDVQLERFVDIKPDDFKSEKEALAAKKELVTILRFLHGPVADQISELEDEYAEMKGEMREITKQSTVEKLVEFDELLGDKLKEISRKIDSYIGSAVSNLSSDSAKKVSELAHEYFSKMCTKLEGIKNRLGERRDDFVESGFDHPTVNKS